MRGNSPILQSRKPVVTGLVVKVLEKGGRANEWIEWLKVKRIAEVRWLRWQGCRLNTERYLFQSLLREEEEKIFYLVFCWLLWNKLMQIHVVTNNQGSIVFI